MNDMNENDWTEQAALSLPKTYIAPQDLVDYATGRISSDRQLLVRAYLERHPEEKAAVMEWRAEYRKEMAEPQASVLPTWIGHLAPLVGVRSGSQNDSLTFYASQLNAQVTLYTLPTDEVAWMIEGFVTMEKAPVADCGVTLITPTDNRHIAHSDEGGFFTFENLTPGTYHLKIAFEHGNLAVPDIVIANE